MGLCFLLKVHSFSEFLYMVYWSEKQNQQAVCMAAQELAHMTVVLVSLKSWDRLIVQKCKEEAQCC